MSKKSTENANTKKLILEYSNKVNYYLKENSNLKQNLDDIKTTLKINKDLLFSYAVNSNEDSKEIQEINDLKNENNILIENIDSALIEKKILEKKLFKIQQDLEDRLISDKESIEKLTEEINILQNKISEKDAIIEHLKNELDKIFTQHESSIKREVLVTEPTKSNIDLNNELNYTKDILAKISKMLATEKRKNEQIEAEVNKLQEELNTLKKNNGLEIVSQNENKENELENSSSFDSDNKSDFSDESHIDTINDIKFPDKVHMKEDGDKSLNFKLDFQKVYAKYQQPQNNMKGKIKPGAEKKVEKKKPMNKKELEEEQKLNSIIDNLKQEINKSTKEIKEMNAKYEKNRNINLELKMKISKLNENLKIANSKIEILENQIKNVNSEKNSDMKVSLEGSLIIVSEENVCNTENYNNLEFREPIKPAYNTIEYANNK